MIYSSSNNTYIYKGYNSCNNKCYNGGQYNMELKQVQNKVKERKTTNITVRTFPSTSKWMKENNISPTMLFNKAVEELKKQ